MVFGTIAVSYVLSKQIISGLKEAREARIQREREDRAQSIQLALITAAADKSSNTVTLVPAPPAVEIPNSDSPVVDDAEVQV